MSLNWPQVFGPAWWTLWVGQDIVVLRVVSRQRVVLLRTSPTSSPLRPAPPTVVTGTVNGMNPDDPLGPDPYQTGGTTRVSAANMHWHDAELALKVARHNYERWVAAGHEDTRSPAIMHAYYTHEALDEAARAITLLIDTFRSEAAASPTTAAHTNIPTRHR